MSTRKSRSAHMARSIASTTNTYVPNAPAEQHNFTMMNGTGMESAGMNVEDNTMNSLAATADMDASGLAAAQGSVTALLIRHLQDDLGAYKYDRDYCAAQLRAEGGLSGQEVRSLRLRMLDLGHHIRLAQHKMELLQAMATYEEGPPTIENIINGLNSITSFSPINSSSFPLSMNNADNPNLALLQQATAASPPVVGKRGRKSGEGRPAKKPKHATIKIQDLEENPGNQVQRLGEWSCRLCKSPKFLGAGEGRQPAAPCKWPLRDVSKMIVHLTGMHHEHTPAERCAELGDALESNRGPFEYWLKCTRNMDLGDGAIMDELINELKTGVLPNIIRRLSKAAAKFPNGDDEE